MLILTRLHGEQIVVRTPEGREIVTTQVITSDGKTKIGVEADREVTIHRREVQKVIDRQQGR